MSWCLKKKYSNFLVQLSRLKGGPRSTDSTTTAATILVWRGDWHRSIRNYSSIVFSNHAGRRRRRRKKGLRERETPVKRMAKPVRFGSGRSACYRYITAAAAAAVDRWKIKEKGRSKKQKKWGNADEKRKKEEQQQNKKKKIILKVPHFHFLLLFIWAVFCRKIKRGTEPSI